MFGLSLRLPSQVGHQQANHRHLHEGFAGLRVALIRGSQDPQDTDSTFRQSG
jgi:hypothetical protein